MRSFAVAILAISLSAHAKEALAYACNTNHYVNVSGHLVHSPTCVSEPGHHTAHCRDGSESFSEHHQGTCSHHGGVDHWE